MGNNPSRPNAGHHGHSHHGHQTPSSSGSTLPSFAAPRSTASHRARHMYRRNSLQHPPNAPSGPATLHPDAPAAHSHYRHAPPPRRESLAEGVVPVSSYNHGAIPPTKEELLEDAATLRQFPTPPTPKSTAAPAAMTFAEIDFGGGGGGVSRPGGMRQTSSAFSQPFAPATPKPAGDIPGPRARRGSMESTVSMSEPDLSIATDARAIPTLVTWPADGEKVYLTGTFCGWEKRYRLSKHMSDNVMSALVPIPPGTHHVKFLVDGEMRTSTSLPTAVDDTGILVNYLEVSADELPPLDRQMSHESQEAAGHGGAGAEGVQLQLSAVSTKRYTTEIPAYLREYMEGTDDDDDGPTEGGPPPPSLPMMLQKVILNTSTQMKDDASVLTIPNHAVLNHLATSSIKNHILAVSATTRYKKKVYHLPPDYEYR